MDCHPLSLVRLLHTLVVAAVPTGIVLAVNATYTGEARAPFAIFLITLLLLAVTVVVRMTPWSQSEAWQHAQGAVWLTHAVQWLQPILPAEFGKFLS